MDLTSIIGLVGGLLVVVVVLILDGGSPMELFAAPSAILLIFGGATMATVITSSLSTVTKIPGLFGVLFKAQEFHEHEAIEHLVSMADRARREGLLALEEDSKKITDPFLQRGIMMVVDGVDPAQVRAILETNIQQMQSRHRSGIQFFAAAGGFAPTFGIIGTVMGLISVLKQLDDPSKLAGSIATAFLATLWGLLSSNLIFLPFSAKLKLKSEQEVHVRYMMLEGIMSIQAGENPRIVKDKLTAYLPPNLAKGGGDEAKAAAAPQGQPQKAKA
jgi:chemotaxis protein MotA